MTTLYKNTGSLQYIPETNIILSKKKKTNKLLEHTGKPPKASKKPELLWKDTGNKEEKF